jgi:Phage integrase family
VSKSHPSFPLLRLRFQVSLGRNKLRPTVLRAGSTKSRKPADQPFPESLAGELRNWLRDKPSGQSVFPLNHDTAKAIRADLEDCGVPYATDDGVADFHSLRSYYGSALVRSGATIAEVHKLARHAKAETTLKHYAKVSRHDLRGALEAMPAPKPSGMDRESMDLAATGTDGQSISRDFAHYLPTDKDGSMRTHAVADATAGPGSQSSLDSETLENQAQDGCVRFAAGTSAERGGFEPPKPVSQFNGLANRRYRPLSHLSRQRAGDSADSPIINANRNLPDRWRLRQ